jgi:aldose 1-epimerase
MQAAPTSFGRLADGRAAQCFTLASETLRVRITDFGARMVSIEAPDRGGVFGHVLLGFDDAEAYLEAGGSFGAILGRYANRIAGGQFVLDGVAYQLAVNDPGGTLHGGPQGSANNLWQVERFDSAANELVMLLESPDGDQGFPGALRAEVIYRLAGSRLDILLSATTDKPTVVNLSAHPYFNFAGVAGGDCLGHEIFINADYFLPTDDKQIPTGERRAVTGQKFDFRKPIALGTKIRNADQQLVIARGYDHCFVLNERGPAAIVVEPVSGRAMRLFTDQPGLQLYSGNSLDGSIIGRGGITYRQSAGFALEAQNFPDAPNQAKFPSAVLRPGQKYSRSIAYEFFAA